MLARFLLAACLLGTAAVARSTTPVWTHPLLRSDNWGVQGTGGKVATNSYAAYYLTPFDSNCSCYHAEAVSLASGELMWRADLGWNHIWPGKTPSATDDYVAFPAFTAVAMFDARTGALVWKKQFGSEQNNVVLTAGPKIVSAGVVVSRTNATIMLSLKDGSTVWELPYFYPRFYDSGRLAYTSRHVFVEADVDNTTSVVAIDFVKGTMSWTAPLPDYGAKLWVRDQDAHGPIGSLIVAYDASLTSFSIPNNGTVEWTVPLVGSGSFFTTVLGYHAGLIVTQVHGGHPGFNVTALNATTGEQVWASGPYQGFDPKREDAVGIMPMVCGKEVVFSDLSAVFGLDLTTGSVTWTAAPYNTAPNAQIFVKARDLALTIYSPIPKIWVLAAFRTS